MIPLRRDTTGRRMWIDAPSAMVIRLDPASVGDPKVQRFAAKGGRNLSLIVKNGFASWVLGWNVDGKSYCRGLGAFPAMTMTDATNKADDWRARLRTVGGTALSRDTGLMPLPAPAVPAYPPQARRAPIQPAPRSGEPRAPAGEGEHQTSLPYDRLPAFMAKLGDDVKSRCLRFVILTGARISEACGADWSEIDLAAKTWTVPVERMKAKREHRVALPDAAIAALGAPGSGPVFGLKRGQMNTFIVRADIAERVDGELVTLHGFRATFGQWAQDTGDYSDELIDAALAHVKRGRVTRAYLRSDLLAQRRPMADAWARFATGRAAA